MKRLVDEWRVRGVALAVVLLLGGCQREAPAGFSGYVEGEYLYLAAPQGGYLQTLDAARGTRVAAGARLFEIAAEPEAYAVGAAQARADSARERARNLRAPGRVSEIAALAAQVRAAESALRLAQTQFAQQESLASRNFISQARLDEARAGRDSAAAQLDAARQQLATRQAALGRGPEVRAAEAETAAAVAGVAQARWQLERKTVLAPAAGEVAETYFHPGEWVPAGSAVASLLPDASRLIRFFVPETALAGLRAGQAVEARCDGCATPIAAKIDFIAAQPEYTPPVIFSRESRSRLVYRVEARPAAADAIGLRPGLPVEVHPAGPAR